MKKRNEYNFINKKYIVFFFLFILLIFKGNFAFKNNTLSTSCKVNNTFKSAKITSLLNDVLFEDDECDFEKEKNKKVFKFQNLFSGFEFTVFFTIAPKLLFLKHNLQTSQLPLYLLFCNLKIDFCK